MSALVGFLIAVACFELGARAERRRMRREYLETARERGILN